MPRMAAEVYAAHIDNVLKLAKQEGGVSRPQIISELNVSRPVANALIEKAGLVLDRKEGRTEYFVTEEQWSEENKKDSADTADVKTEDEPEKVETKQSRPGNVPDGATAVAEPVSDESNEEEGEEDFAAELARLDAELLDTRQAIRDAAAKAGKAKAEWATQDGIVAAMQQRLTELLKKRIDLCS